MIIGALTLAAVWIVATVGPFDRTQTPTAPGSAATVEQAGTSGGETGAGGTVDVTLREFAVVPSLAIVPAGVVTFQVTNEGPDDVHEFVVIQDTAPGPLPTGRAGSVNERGLQRFPGYVTNVGPPDNVNEFVVIPIQDTAPGPLSGEVEARIEDIAVGDTRTLTLGLGTGKYFLICNIVEEMDGEVVSHYQEGMRVDFWVRLPAVATTPSNEPPTVNPADAAAEEVAHGFLDAYAAFDAQKAMTYVADDADLRNLIDVSHQIPANAEGLSLRLSLLQAMGVELTVTSCEAAPIGSDTSVVCESVFHALGSDQIGRGPFSNSSFVFTVRDGAIVRVGFGPEPMDKFDRQMWEPFAAWVSSTYPKDAAVMYLDGTGDGARFSLESIRLWERHTREYVETRSAETGPAETALAGEPDVQRAAECSFVQPPARAHLELTDVGYTIKARFVLHQMTLPGHRWRIVLRQAHPSGFFPQADDWRPLFEGTRLATGDSGHITVQRSVGHFGFVFVRAKASDRQTGQFCRVTELDAGLVSL